MRRLTGLVLILWAVLLKGSSPDYESAQRKLAAIENGHAAPGSRVTLTARELNAWVREEVREAVQQGLREPRVELGHGMVSGYALVDFLKLREMSDAPQPGWLLSKLLEGERAVRVAARIRSSGGYATVDVEQVEISGVTITGNALDFLVEHFLRPRLPDAKIGEPFEIGNSIERLELRPAAVDVVMMKAGFSQSRY